MRIVEHCGSALRNHHRRVVFWCQVRTFEVYMGVDEARRDIAVRNILHHRCIASGSAGMHAGDPWSGQADIGLSQFRGGRVDHGAVQQQNVKRRLPQRRSDRALPRFVKVRHIHRLVSCCRCPEKIEERNR